MDTKDRQALIARHMGTRKGRKALVGSMVGPLHVGATYKTIMSKVFHHDAKLTSPTTVVEEEWSQTYAQPWTPERMERLVDRVREQGSTVVAAVLTKHALAMISEATEIQDGNIKEGDYENVMMHVRTYSRLLNQKGLDKLNPNILGNGMGMYKGAHIIPSRHIEPGLLYGIGPQDEIGKYRYNLELEDNSTTQKNAEQSLTAFGIKAKVTIHATIRPSPDIAVYRYTPPPR